MAYHGIRVVLSFCFLRHYTVQRERIDIDIENIIVLYLQIFNIQNYPLFKISTSDLFLKYS